MPRTFLIASVAGLLLVLNGRRPLRLRLFVVPAFFSSWLVVELAPQLLVLHIVGVVLFVLNGALATWVGWLGLAISAVIAVLLLGLFREAYNAKDVLDEALDDAIGADQADRPLAWREFAFPFKLWSRKIKRVRDLPYAAPGTRRYRLDVWHRPDERTDRPCVLYVPGGAWTVGISNKNQQGKPLLIELSSQGWVCFAMNYPLSPRATFPAHIIAVKQAIAWIREHAHEYGGDAGFIMITGNSAGGHLSSLAALTPNEAEYQPDFEDVDTTIQAAAPLYGVYDFSGAMIDELPRTDRLHKVGMLRFLEMTIVRKRRAKEPKIFESLSPWHRVSADAPPFLVIHGEKDTLALPSEARAFAGRLRDVSTQPVVYVELPRAQHAFDQFLSIRTIFVVRAIARFGAWAHERWLANRDAGSGPQRDQALRSPTSPN